MSILSCEDDAVVVHFDPLGDAGDGEKSLSNSMDETMGLKQ